MTPQELCPNDWHRSAPARMHQLCPECPGTLKVVFHDANRAVLPDGGFVLISGPDVALVRIPPEAVYVAVTRK